MCSNGTWCLPASEAHPREPGPIQGRRCQVPTGCWDWAGNGDPRRVGAQEETEENGGRETSANELREPVLLALLHRTCPQPGTPAKDALPMVPPSAGACKVLPQPREAGAKATGLPPWSCSIQRAPGLPFPGARHSGQGGGRFVSPQPGQLAPPSSHSLEKGGSRVPIAGLGWQQAPPRGKSASSRQETPAA